MDDRILDKLDRIEAIQTKQEVHLGKLTVSVEEHVKRTNLLEEDVRPIKKHVAMVEGALKLIALAGILATIVEAIHLVFR